MEEIKGLLLGLGLPILLFLALPDYPFSVELQDKGIDDLLLPDFPSKNRKLENSDQLAQKSKERDIMEDLIGPKEVFPFLPDNHRDSGTGKFNAF